MDRQKGGILTVAAKKKTPKVQEEGLWKSSVYCPWDEISSQIMLKTYFSLLPKHPQFHFLCAVMRLHRQSSLTAGSFSSCWATGEVAKTNHPTPPGMQGPQLTCSTAGWHPRKTSRLHGKCPHRALPYHGHAFFRINLKSLQGWHCSGSDWHR